ncbi:MAG: translation initiation factor IF-2 [Bacillota bacterium]|nr:translation initiation factor IF-2 [Bacillota bacterium]
MPTKEKMAETKIVKADASKASTQDAGASKVQIRAVDKAIIEAQAAKSKKAAAPKKTAAKKPAETATTTAKKPVTKVPVGKAMPKSAMGKAMPKNAVPQKKKVEEVVPEEKVVPVVEVPEIKKAPVAQPVQEVVKETKPVEVKKEEPAIDYAPEIGIKIISKAGDASQQKVEKPTNIVRREAPVQKKEAPKEKKKPKEFVGRKKDEPADKAPRKKNDVQRGKGDKVVAFTAAPTPANDKRRKDKDKKDKRDYLDVMPSDLERKNKNKHSKYKEKVEEVDEMEAFEATVEAGSVIIQVPITLAGFCEQVEKTTSEAIMALMKMGIMANINQNLDEETAVLLGMELGVNVAVAKVNEEQKEEGLNLEADRESDLMSRPPVITVMGHVDHGKTSILDAIRSTNVTAGEAGGITQHIGASEVDYNGQKIVFLDTPGHEAFTAMRARGAYITDIAVLVVAADDSVKPQTIESISHAKAANVPIIVAINKMDKPAANPDLVKKDLADNGVLVEDWGGDVICVPVSAKTGMGIDKLLEMILLQAEMLELKANPNRLAQGTVIEAKLDKARGPVASLLVTRGTIQAGQALVVGTASGRIRVMNNWKGEPIKKAGPSRAVEITGLTEVPEAGDEFYVVKDDKTAREIAERRKEKLRQEVLAKSSAVSLEKLFSQLEEGDIKELNLILKADVQGSVGALEQSLEKLRNEDAKVNIIHTGVGAINESDVMLASTSNAVIIGFNVRPSAAVQTQADNAKVEIRTYRIIYEIIEDIEAALKGMLNPEFKEVVLGSAEVRDTFKVPNVGLIAGAYVISGKITRNAKLRLVREGVVIHEGEVGSLKRFKDDAKEVATGFECGIGIEKYNDIKVGDVIEAFEIQEVKKA